MKERRSLVEGLTQTPKQVEEAFVYGKKRQESVPATTEPKGEPPESPQTIEIDAPRNQAPSKILPQMQGRVPISIRCRSEIASAVKRISLERQLAGVEPYYVQDIIEEAIEQWLSTKGYL